ncbi:MAG: TetR family transcriptional regulator [Gemmatimonadota bacterium]|nr:MAG: TetR family transcriptional regulator [Gemmatimonadota bacterium]
MAKNTLPATSEHEEKLERLLAVAAEIFAEKGYHHASIRELSRRAGVSLSGLYYYFSSKEELLFMIQERSLRRVLDGLKHKLKRSDEPAGRLRAMIGNHVGFFAQNMAAMKVLTHEFDSLEGKYKARIRDLRLEYSNLCTELLRELRRSTGSDEVLPLNVATSALFGMMNWIYTGYQPGSSIPVDRLSEHLFRLFTGGFSSSAEPAASLERRVG